MQRSLSGAAALAPSTLWPQVCQLLNETASVAVAAQLTPLQMAQASHEVPEQLTSSSVVAPCSGRAVPADGPLSHAPTIPRQMCTAKHTSARDGREVCCINSQRRGCAGSWQTATR